MWGGWSGTNDSSLTIFFRANAGGDTTLLVRLPDGRWICNDDSPSWANDAHRLDSLDPLLDLDTPPEGQYDIWVGSYERGKFISGTLGIVESVG